MALGCCADGLRPHLLPAEVGTAAREGAVWEARRMAAHVLWLKSHAVLHAGLEEKPADVETEKAAAGHVHDVSCAHEKGSPPLEGWVAAPRPASSREESGLHHGEEHHAVAPAIPAADRDFRGVLGDLERAVKPYLAPDGKPYAKDADQTIPFYQLVTWADPHFIPGYTIGAMAICRGGKHPERAIAFLEEGLRKNPGSFEIRTELGRYHLVYRRDFRTAEAHLLEALRLVARRREFTEEEEESLTDCFRWLTLCYREGGHPARAVQTALLGLSRIGPDATLRHTLQLRGRRAGSQSPPVGSR